MTPRGIDIHTHVVPATFPAYSGNRPDVPWPAMRHTPCDHAQILLAGKLYREVESDCWNVPRRLADMKQAGIARQVLSPMPELLSYWMASDDTAVLCTWMNEQIAAMVGESPDRLTGLGIVPLQDPERAAGVLGTIMGELGLAGVEIGTNVLGRSIGDPMFTPFFAEAERLGAAIFVHALHPAGKERLVGPAALEQVAAFPGETALAIVSMITGGMLERHPGLKIAFSHGGGAFGLVLPRLQHAWETLPAVSQTMPKPPRDYARRLSYDTLVYDRRTLRFLIETYGITQLMVGSDYPFSIREPDPCGRIAKLGLTGDEEDLLLFANAEKFLAAGGLSPDSSRGF